MRMIDADAITKRMIAFCDKNCPYTPKERDVMCGACFMGAAMELLEDAPTIEPERKPERLADDDFETIRIHLNAYKEKLCNQQRWAEADEYQRIIDRFMAFASAQPENEERKEESAQNVLKDDSVSRKAAIDAVNGVIADYIPTLYGRYEALPLEMAMAIIRLPTAEPTLYGYNIKHLAFVATVMEKEGVTAEYAARTFDDMSRASRMIIEELQEKVEKSLSAMQLPSAQPEIIRCNECLMHGVCRFEQGLGLDGYCSQAERRTDEYTD